MQPHLEPVELEVRKVLESPNKPIEHSYFIERGLASIVLAIVTNASKLVLSALKG